MDTTTSFSQGQLFVVVLWNIVFLVPILAGAAVLFRRRALLGSAALALWAVLLLVLPAWYASSVNYSDGSEPLFQLVALYLASWIAVALLAGLLLMPLAFAWRKPRSAGTGNH